jgi:hypothetical protein
LAIESHARRAKEAAMKFALDVIGDVHGEMPALQALGRELGYDVQGGWRHPDNRLIVFLGDLVDRGAYSFEVADLVRVVVAERRAICLMGNHEYNIAAWSLGVPGYQKPKRSNRATITEIEAAPERWRPILDWMRDLPVGIDLPDLRVIHACWHRKSLDQVRGLLEQAPRTVPDNAAPFDVVGAHVVLKSPFTTAGLIPGLPGDTADFSCVIPHEDLIKGYEVDAAEPFHDNDGKLRSRIRAMWWRDGLHDVLTDRPQGFGHYWNVPPIDGNVAPLQPAGHPELRAYSRRVAERCPPIGRMPMTGDIACIDFQGITRVTDRACIGALRWPEREIVWAMATKTAACGDED